MYKRFVHSMVILWLLINQTYRVKEFGELAEVIPPTRICHPNS